MNNAEHNSSASQQQGGINTPAAILWASAFILAGMLISQLGQTPGRSAHAEMVTKSASGLSLMTTRSSNTSQDYVTVLDSPTHQLYVYAPTIRRGFELIVRVELDQAFASGRRASE